MDVKESPIIVLGLIRLTLTKAVAAMQTCGVPIPPLLTTEIPPDGEACIFAANFSQSHPNPSYWGITNIRITAG